MLIGKTYEAQKKSQGGTGVNQHTVKKEQTGQNVHSATPREVKDGTAGRLAKELGVDERTVRRAEKFAKGTESSEAFRAFFLSRNDHSGHGGGQLQHHRRQHVGQLHRQSRAGGRPPRRRSERERRETTTPALHLRS